jgi:hypothetical protein
MLKRSICPLFNAPPTRRSRRLLTGCLVLASAAFGGSLHAAPATPKNLALGLEQLSQEYRKALPANTEKLTHDQFAKLISGYKLARYDENDRVQVEVTLDGAVPIEKSIAAYEKLGCTITATVPWYHQGVLSMWMPLNQADALARTPGVDSVKLSLKPKHWGGYSATQGYGLVPGQGASVLNCPQVIANGYTGAGITVGAQSDSYNALSNSYPVHAAQDIASGDLPGTGNPNGYTTAVNVLEDYPAGAGTEDEGRAMLQIIHDCAPAAALAFSTADISEASFASNITALAGSPSSMYTISTISKRGQIGTKSVAGAGCKVVCDDVGYYDEPMFSDGVVAQAVDKATAVGAVYFSAAGNDGNSGYASTYAPVTNGSTDTNGNTTTQLLLSEGGITYSGISSAEASAIESFHSFGTNAAGDPILVQKVFIPESNAGGTSYYPGTIVLQWNDPDGVVTGGIKQVSTDYDILVFSVAANGTATYQPNYSGTSSNFSTNIPEEIPSSNYPLLAGTQYEFVIVRTNRAGNTGGPTRNEATQIRWAVETDATQVIADFVTPSMPNSYGHPCAATCAGMAAYVYDDQFLYSDATYTPIVEAYASNGPTYIYFDAAGNRLATPITRKQPLLSAVDGVSTTFFPPATGTVAPGPANPSPYDSDGDGYPNFFGTSATGPHAAGCAALILSAAAANGITLSPADVHTLMVQTTQGQSDQNPSVSNATAGTTTFSARDRSTFSDPQAFTITYNGAPGTTLNTLVVDESTLPLGGEFIVANYPVTTGAATSGTGGTAPSIASSTVSGGSTNNETLTLTLANFTPGSTLSFGVCQTVGVSGGEFYIHGDQLAGTTITSTDSTGTTASGVLANTYGKQWNYKTGYGLIDVNAAVNRLLGH